MADITEPVKVDDGDEFNGDSLEDHMDVEGSADIESSSEVNDQGTLTRETDGEETRVKPIPSQPEEEVENEQGREFADDVDALRPEEDDTGEAVMSDPESGPQQEGKRVKVCQ